MARTTKEESQKTRQRIIDTAIELFFRNGVSATTLENIAEAASLTRGAIYWHFKNKQDVIAAIHDQLHLSILDTMYKELRDKSLPPLDRIRRASKHFFRAMQNDEQCRMILTIFLLKCDYSGDMAMFLERQIEKKKIGREIFTECFQEAKDRGDINGDWPAKFLAQTHQYYISGIMQERLKRNEIAGLEKDVDKFLDFYFDKLEKK